jgi:cytochrome b561
MIRDTAKGFGLVSILLHWFVAALIIALWFDGEAMEHAVGPAARESHIAWGLFASVFIFWRVIWRLMSGNPAPRSEAPTLNLIAKIVKYALLADMVLVVVTGVLHVWFGGVAVQAFGIVNLPSPFANNGELFRLMGGLHNLSTKLFIPLVGLHVLGALKHLVLDRDGTFTRMIWPSRQA